MKLRIENLTHLFLFVVFLLAGCSGCGQKTAEHSPMSVNKTPTAGKDPLLGDVGAVPVPPSLPKIIEPQTPDDYEGDPYLYIPTIEYEQITTSHSESVSYPLLPPRIQQKLDNLRIWSEDGQIMTESGPITEEQRERMRYNIIADDLSDLEMAQFIMLQGLSDNSVRYAAEYAQKALDQNPDDYHTLYVWAAVQMNPVQRENGYRRLLEMNPNSAHVLVMLGRTLTSWHNPQSDIDEGITYLKRSAALSPFLYDALAFRSLGRAYLKLKANDTAIAFYDRAQTIHYSTDTQEIIRLIERGELP